METKGKQLEAQGLPIRTRQRSEVWFHVLFGNKLAMNDTRVAKFSGIPFPAKSGKTRVGPNDRREFQGKWVVFNHLVRLENCTISGQGCVQIGIFSAFNNLDEFC